MRANVDVQECAMQVSQCRLRLRDLPVPGAVCRPGAPDSTGKDANQGEHGGGNGKGGREAQAAARKTERRSVTTHNASANGDRGAGERGVQLGRKQVEGDAPGGRQGDGGRRARISNQPRRTYVSGRSTETGIMPILARIWTEASVTTWRGRYGSVISRSCYRGAMTR